MNIAVLDALCACFGTDQAVYGKCACDDQLIQDTEYRR